MRLSPQLKKEVDQILARYEFKQGAVLPILHRIQEIHGYLIEDILAGVADYLNLPSVDIFEVATFYSFFHTKPVGRNVIWVCDSITCYLRDKETIIEQLEAELGIKVGETTKDSKFTLSTTSCIGACGRAPAMLINDEPYFELTPEKIKEILKNRP